MVTKDVNRKTTIPLKTIPAIVEWLLTNCSYTEIQFMADLAGSRSKFKILHSILTRLTDMNVHEVFFASKIHDPEELYYLWVAKRGEVAGLKAFALACQAAREKINQRKEEEGDQ